MILLQTRTCISLSEITEKKSVTTSNVTPKTFQIHISYTKAICYFPKENYFKFQSHLFVVQSSSGIRLQRPFSHQLEN